MSTKSLYLDFEFDYDFELISIVSSYRDYRLCWYLNKTLGFNLAWKEEVKVEQTKKRQAAGYFNLFSYEDELNKMQYFFVSNKSAGEFLVPELKQVDYFLELSGGNAPEEKERILTALKEVHIVEAVFPTEASALKSKQNLVFE